jgi:hypothetical protein
MYVIKVVMNLVTDILCSSFQRFIGEKSPLYIVSVGKGLCRSIIWFGHPSYVSTSCM